MDRWVARLPCPPGRGSLVRSGVRVAAGALSALAGASSTGYGDGMTQVEKLEREIAALSPSELAEFRRWYAEFDAAAWDRQVAAHAEAGALDGLADEALAEHEAGRSRPL
jgi:hypothetical protein